MQNSKSKVVLAIVFAFIVASAAFAQTQPPPLPAKTSANQAIQEWPDAPESYPASGGIVPILILAPTFGLPSGNPIVPVVPVITDSSIRGRLAYAPFVTLAEEHMGLRFLVLHQIAPKEQSPKTTSSFVSYKVLEGDVSFFDPQFSPDGRHMAFKYGYPSLQYGGYRLYLWDFAAKTLRQVIKSDRVNLSYPVVRWSPDSNYLAFIKRGGTGGQELSDSQGRSITPQLFIYNRKTGQSRLVAELSAGVVDFTWTQQNTLLYTVKVLDPKHGVVGARLGTQWDKLNRSIYEVSASDNQAKPKQIIKNAFGAASSPDGKYIVFSGWKPPALPNAPLTSATALSSKPSLWLFDRVSNKTTLVRPLTSSVVRWLPDSKKFLVIYAIPNTNQVKGQSESKIATFDIVSMKETDLTTVETRDYENLSRAESYAPLKALDVSKDGRYLFVQTSEITALTGRYYRVSEQLRAVDLKNGKTSLVFSLVNSEARVHGWSWHDESTPLPTQTK